MKVRGEGESGLKFNIQKTKIMASGPINLWQIDGETIETVRDYTFWDSKITGDGDCSHEIKCRFFLGRKAMTNLDSVLSRHFSDKGLYSQSYGFSSSHVWMWWLDHKEGWTPKNWCLQIVVLEKTLKSPFDSKEIKPVNPKGNKPSLFIGRTDAEAEAPILWPPDAKSQLIEKERPLCCQRLKAKRERRGQPRIRWFDSISDSMDMNLSKLQKIVEKRGVRGAAVHGIAFRHNWVTEQQKWNMSSFPSLLFS